MVHIASLSQITYTFTHSDTQTHTLSHTHAHTFRHTNTHSLTHTRSLSLTHWHVQAIEFVESRYEKIWIAPPPHVFGLFSFFLVTRF